jgi:PAS domain S-box-containing protein
MRAAGLDDKQIRAEPITMQVDYPDLSGPDLSSLFESLPAPCLVVRADDPIFTIVGVSDALVEAKGIPRERLLGRPIVEFFSCDGRRDESRNSDVAAMLASLRRVIATGKPDLLPQYRQQRNGQIRCWNPTNKPVLHCQSGAVRHILYWLDDVTAKVRAEEQLQISERRLRLALLAGRIGSFEWLPKEGRIIWTKELEAIFGLREGEFKGTFEDWSKRATPEDARRLVAEMQECLARHQKDYRYEFRAVLPDGSFRWLRGHTQFFYDESGVFERAIGVNIDIDAQKNAENSLYRQRQIFDGAFSNTPDHNYTFDLDGRITYANRALLHLWQKSLEEVLGKNFFDLGYPNELATQLHQQIQQVISTGEHIKDHTAFTAADGISHYYDYVFLPVFNSDGEVEAVAGSTRDITEQNRSAELVQKDRRRWRDLLLQAPAAIAVLKGPNHLYEWFNNDYLKLVSRPAEALNGKGIREALPELIDQGFIQVFDEVYRTGVPYSNPEAHAFLGENGAHEMYVNFVCLPTRDAEGKVDGIFVHATDITSHVTARRQLEESEKRYRFLAESMPQMVWTATSEGVLDYVSQPVAMPIGSGWLTGIHPEDESHARELWSECVGNKLPYQNELRLRHGDKGDWHWFLVRALPMGASEEHILCWVGTCTDIHDQKQAEVALRTANRELEEFAYVASHDLQEPLRMVSVYTHLIIKSLGDTADSKLSYYAGVVLQCVSRMEALIHDVLEFSRIAHSDEGSLEEADLADSFSQALTVLKNRIEEKGALIKAAKRLPRVCGETRHLTHVFQNLLSNALKYSKKEEPPVIVVSVRREGDNWVISVTDNGIGFDQQYADRIFGLFKRLHKGEYPGTGLGLAICHRIVERYGGRIWAEGHPGEGATFSFALPCIKD